MRRCFYKRCLRRILWILCFGALLAIFCEYLLYYVVIAQCSWPTLPTTHLSAGSALRVMVLADPHLVGVYRGHYLDRTIRDWKMARAFEAAMLLHSPDVVFILGDLFDEGSWCNDAEFDRQLVRYHRIFKHDTSSTVLKNLVGNHDIGFHYAIHPYLDWRFRKRLTPSENSAAVRLWVRNGIPFVLANSMAFEGDACDLCREASANVDAIAEHLMCSPRVRSRNASACPPKHRFDRMRTYMDADSETEQLRSYIRPILLQHFPLYRPNELDCDPTLPDAMPARDRPKKYRPKWDCLSKDASKQLLRKLKPRLVLSGHSHYSCILNHRIPDDDQNNLVSTEWSVASFSWRNLPNPSFLMMTVTTQHYDIHTCYLHKEITTAFLFITGMMLVLFWPYMRRFYRHVRCRLLHGCVRR